MSRSPLPDNFDPFANHPFTNGSGVVPPAPYPSQYPILIPTYKQPAYYTSSSPSSSLGSTTSSSSSPPSSQAVRSPQPQSSQSGSSASPPGPVFVPFKQERATPDLILKKGAKPTKDTSARK